MNRKIFEKYAVEKGTREKRQLKNQELDSFYEGRILEFKSKPTVDKDDSDCEDIDGLPIDEDGLVSVSRPAIVCTDINGLFAKVFKLNQICFFISVFVFI